MNFADIFVAPEGRLRPTWRALIFVPLFLLIAFAAATVITFIVGPEMLWGNQEAQLFSSGLIMASSAAFAAYLLLLGLDRRSFRNLGLWFYPGWGRELTVGLAGGFGLISFTVGLLFVAGQIESFSLQTGFEEALRGLSWNLLLLLPAATAEELVFRGYPFQRLVEAAGKPAAVLILSAVFGWLHFTNPSASLLSTANTILMGILLAVAYLKTRGLWLPVGLHFIWNYAMGFFYSLPVSGIVVSQKLFKVEVGPQAWLSGGNYGPEGSVLTTAVVLGAIVWLARTRHLGVSSAVAKELE